MKVISDIKAVLIFHENISKLLKCLFSLNVSSHFNTELHCKVKCDSILIDVLKLWLSFFCLSFARARTSASAEQRET